MRRRLGPWIWLNLSSARALGAGNSRAGGAAGVKARHLLDKLVPHSLPGGAESPSRGLEDLIRSGPILQEAGLSLDEFEVNRWVALGDKLAMSLGLLAAMESARTRSRLYWLYLPIYEWIRRKVDTKSDGRPLFVGLHCPQGGGKTTMCEALRQLFEFEGRTCVVMSIDDFYYTHAQLTKLAGIHPNNPLLHGRGNPGTHDADLMLATLDSLLAARSDATVRIPRYDKSARKGQGDRRAEAEWPEVSSANVDLVILEGWCLGFQPQGDRATGQLSQVDKYLAADLASVYGRFDAFIVIRVPDINVVYTWREQAEQGLRDQGRGAMTPDEVRKFVDRYMPVYHLYIPALYAVDLVPGATLHVTIDAERQPTACLPT